MQILSNINFFLLVLSIPLQSNFETPFKGTRKSTFMSKKFALILLFITAIVGVGNASESGDGESFNTGELIMHHISDAHEWHLWDGAYGTIPLPVILYSGERGLEVFMSSKFEHGHASYKGYKMDQGHIVAEDGHSFVDLSITKNVAQLLLNVVLMLWLFIAVARAYSRRKGMAPKGIQSLIEPIIVFIRDEIVKPNIGEKKYERYMPYFLTLFFFIWIGNLSGLTPGAANLTGNIAVTMVLALMTFIITQFSGKKNYWKHVFWTPGVPTPIKFIIVPVEFISLFTKPFSLMIRLFVAITAGHIVLLSLMFMTFIFHSWVVGIGSSVIVLVINIIELLVATIQAYVFTLFSSMYIGTALEEEHH